MALKEQVKDGAVILTPMGSLWGGPETDEVEARIVELSRDGNERLLINLSKTEHMTSPAIAVVTKAYTGYKDRGAQLRLCGVGARIQQILVITRLCLVFGDDQYETEEEALASFIPARTT